MNFKTSSLFSLFIIGLYFCLHLPFIESDPILTLSRSRGSFTDEGLNTCQVRNYINQEKMKITDSDNLVKTPFFSLILLPIYKISGTGLTAGRITTLALLCLFLAVCAFDKYWKYLSSIFIVTSGLQAHIFQFTHLALPEMACITFILTGIYCLYKYEILNTFHKKSKFLLLSILFFSLSYYTKIQYIYILVLPILFTALKLFISFFKTADNKTLKNNSQFFTICITTILFFGGLYYLAWYRPNKDIYNYILINQTTNRFVEWGNFWNIVEENYREVFLTAHLKWYTYLFFICLPLSIAIYIRSNNHPFKIVFSLSFLWLLLELHKIAVWWLPGRYTIGIIVPMGIITANLLYELIYQHKSNINRKLLSKTILYTAMIMITGLFIYNCFQYAVLLSERKYSLKRANEYFSNYNLEASPMMGTWATNLNWQNKAYTMTVWKEYFNDKNVIENFHPKVIITEYDEADSDQAFMSQGVNLSAMADSVKCMEIGKWDILIYWLP